jgi:hypothetical protein
MYNTTRQAVNRLVQRLQLPEHVTDLQINFSAEAAPTMTVTRLLTPQEVDELSTWYVVERLEGQPRGEMTYDLVPRPPEEQPALASIDPQLEGQRQQALEQRYLEEGRNDPSHPRHGFYTGLMSAEEPEPAAA